MIHVAKPDSFTSPEGDGDYLDRILPSLIDTRNRETTALLAVMGELLVDDPEWQLQCRREVDERGEHLPRWIGALSQVGVYRAVRSTDQFGDIDDLVVGMGLEGGHELTVGVRIDHNIVSSVVDAAVVHGPIDEAIAWVAESSSETSVFEMALNDARAWIEDALNKPTLLSETETWPLYRPLVQWLVNRLPEGGERRSPAGDWESNENLCNTFFASSSAAPFTEAGHREMLLDLFESGNGDPLRWSEARVERAISVMSYFGDRFPLEVALDAPDLLRAFIPSPTRRAGSGRTDIAHTRCDRRAAIELQARCVEIADYWWLDDAG